MPRVASIVLAVLVLVAPAAASADFVHVVAPGETLTSIAAADGMSVAQLAAANGISPYTQLVAGAGIQIPPQAAPQGLPQSQGQVGDGDNDGDDPQPVATSGPSAPAASGSYVVQPGDTLTAIAARAGVSVAGLAAINGIDPNAPLLSGTPLRLSGSAGSAGSSSSQFVSTRPPVTSAPAVSGSYVVQPGDTLTAIAARAGESVAQLAATNGLDPNGTLLAGVALQLSGSSGSPATAASASTQPVGSAAEGSPTDPPYPTAETVTSGQVGSIASANGVSPSLADAIAYQESGFNNDLVSSADARGVMQILPGTWQWIQHTLNAGGPPLAPASASDNVRGGVLLLRSLLNSTGGDPAMAAAGYYQGLPSVQQNGLYSSTQQYVNDVMALRRQFGGG
jgi:N-acetylmuramoyl-L-alanine amidase